MAFPLSGSGHLMKLSPTSVLPILFDVCELICLRLDRSLLTSLLKPNEFSSWKPRSVAPTCQPNQSSIRMLRSWSSDLAPSKSENSGWPSSMEILWTLRWIGTNITCRVAFKTREAPVRKRFQSSIWRTRNEPAAIGNQASWHPKNASVDDQTLFRP